MKTGITSWSRILPLCLIPCLGAHGKASTTVATGASGETTLVFSMEEGDYQVHPLMVGGTRYSRIEFEDGSRARAKGEPDLPEVAQSIIVPDRSKLRLEIVSSAFSERAVDPVIAAKGRISRRYRRSDIPYVFGEAYGKSVWFPEQCAHLGNPYIAGAFRGSVVYFQPFQYNPATGMLRTYSSITVKISATAEPGENEKTRTGEIRITPDDEAVYMRAFPNYRKSHYKPLNEEGAMLVISHADFMGTIQPLVEWKNRRGVKTELVDAAKIGDAAAIKAYVAQYYKTKGLKYLMLVGDADKVPTNLNKVRTNEDSDNHAADNIYGMIEGTDAYMEVFVGRLSGTTSAHISAQVEKILHYERKHTVGDTWLSHALSTADETEQDDLNAIKYITTALKEHSYSSILQLTKDSENTKLVAEVNKGVGFHTNSSHANETSIQALSVSDVSNMINVGKYPFNMSLGCNPGDFRYSKVCLGETLLRREKGGYVGAYMSSISQAWDEPYAAIKEQVNIMTEKYPDNIKRTFGGVAVNGSFKMLDQFPESGIDEINCWILFGDPNMHIYTDTPKPIAVQHPASVGTGPQSIVISGTEKASICLYSKKMGIQAVSDVAGGKASFSINLNGSSGDTLYVTGTMFNHVTYEGMMTISGATGIQALETGSMKDFSAGLAGRRILYRVPGSAGEIGAPARLVDSHGRRVTLERGE